MEIAAIRRPVADDMSVVDRIIQDRLQSDVALINQLGHYIIGGGGKRLRPMVALLMARAAGHADGDDRHALLGATVELIHTATLLHDDVVDESAVRRGRDTANQIWGNEASVLVGDFLYTRAFQMMVELDDMAVMALFSRTTNRIAEGEVMQLMHVHDPDVTEDRYQQVIYRKTAVLFEAGCQLAVGLNNPADRARLDAAAKYGRRLGIAFQLADDALDYDGDAGAIGKNIGDDLAEGKPTLPLIHCMANADPAGRAIVRDAIESGGRNDIAEVAAVIARTGSIAYTRDLAEQEAERAIRALAAFGDSPFREALRGLAEFAVGREY
ncbi:polyprenyl synthetase family protein [Spiribacter vilamensis]|uniref:Octaprenyl diphosphate synthase n=1 Tax=Spiribacter vilamensis TaxID=531306 RepID=A0A4Q8CYG4_9GAMM|nr:polyprenyl synthetase family protein [Spiribacter vilamensis]RZU97930.1 octaprenyl-diphosphate synthase [Spiribacter vilamensis]TVO61157.1 octaprenyl diphosphate synthase [Spiribacter vilamensis]